MTALPLRPLRALVVDDEPLARRQVRRMLERAPAVTVIGECGAGDDAVAAIERDRPDLVLLDVQMPRLDGFGVIDAVGASRMPAVVFVTAYDEYAIRALRARAVDYLLKPVKPGELLAAVERARAAGSGAAAAPAREYLRRLVLRTDGRMLVIDVRDVDWLEARDNYVAVHAGSAVHTTRGTLGGLAERLDPARFVRIHRSTVVNLERVRELQPWFQGELVALLKDGTRLAVGPTYREAFLHRLEGLPPES